MLENAIIDEIWFFDGDQGYVLGCVEDNPEEWLIEKGILLQESEMDGLEDLLEGDVVYRIRRSNAMKRLPDERESLFSWKEVSIR